MCVCVKFKATQHTCISEFQVLWKRIFLYFILWLCFKLLQFYTNRKFFHYPLAFLFSFLSRFSRPFLKVLKSHFYSFCSKTNTFIFILRSSQRAHAELRRNITAGQNCYCKKPIQLRSCLSQDIGHHHIFVTSSHVCWYTQRK